MTLPLATSTWDEREYEALQRVIRSGQFSMGQEVATFERDFSSFFGSKFSVMVNSGSSANLVMIAAMFFVSDASRRLKAGDEVIVPAVSWSTTYYPLTQYGLKLKFVDIDASTLNYDLVALEAAVSEQTKLIMVVNLLGNPNEFSEIQRIADRHDVTIVEDNCESMGATYNDQFTGTFGLMGTFSTFFSHHISTMEGGVVVTDDEELYQIMLSLRAHGWTRNLPKENLVSGIKSDNPFEESFKFVLPGYNLRPLEMSGALGQEQLRKLPALVRGRRDNAEEMKRVLGDHPLFTLQKEIGRSSWFGFSLMLRPEANCSKLQLVSALNNQGFECRPIVAGNFAKNPVMKYIDHVVEGELTNANYLDEHGLFIGNHHYSISDAIHALQRLRV
jgi:CDP-6-deoxy-D-xylo-4-hexulose-3-dehydrase